MKAPATVLGLVNGMIGGTCLVLPQIGISTGWITTIWVCLICGLIAYYTARLMILHLGEGRHIRDTVMSHFKNDIRYLKMYGFIMFFSFVFVLIIYFQIICLQIEGLLGYNSFWVGPIVTILLIIYIIFIRLIHVG